MYHVPGTHQSRPLTETAEYLVPTVRVGTRIWRRCNHVSKTCNERADWRQWRNIKTAKVGSGGMVLARPITMSAPGVARASKGLNSRASSSCGLRSRRADHPRPSPDAPLHNGERKRRRSQSWRADGPGPLPRTPLSQGGKGIARSHPRSLPRNKNKFAGRAC
jgi:hypothetical protein